jgi:hypothetical protein
VRLAGRLGEGDMTWEVALDPAAAGEGTTIGALAARAEIRDLEERTSRLHGKSGSRQRGRKDARVTKAIVDLGVRYQLASSQTSFVAVEERDGKEAQERGRLVLVPQALTRDWGGVVLASMAPGMAISRSVRHRMVAMDSMDSSMGNVRACMGPPQEYGPLPSQPDRGQDFPDEYFPPKVRTPDHDAVTLLQRADGSWKLDNALAKAVGVKLKTLQRLAEMLRDAPDAETVVATAAALAYLQLNALDSMREWRMLAKKAEAWLDARLAGTGHDRLEVIGLARTAVVRA